MSLVIIELTDKEMILAAGNDLMNALQHADGELYDNMRKRKGFKLYGIKRNDKYVGAFQVESDRSITVCVGYQNKRFKANADRDILLKIKSFINDNNLTVNTDHLKELNDL